MKKLIESTKFCVDNGIAHRDIKLSNIVFPLNDDRASSARLTDFGMAYQISSSGTLKGRCGTPGYVAPEILRADAHEPYGVNVDMFSIGVVSYVLFSGYEPFGGLCPAARISMNKKCMWEFHPLEEWAKVNHIISLSLVLKQTYPLVLVCCHYKLLNYYYPAPPFAPLLPKFEMK